MPFITIPGFEGSVYIPAVRDDTKKKIRLPRLFLLPVVQ